MIVYRIMIGNSDTMFYVGQNKLCEEVLGYEFWRGRLCEVRT